MSAAAEEIKSLSNRMLRAVKARDAATVANFYAEDAAFLVPNRPLVSGRIAVREAWEGLLAAPDIAIDFGPTSVTGGNDVAYEVGTYALSFQTPDGLSSDRGKYLVVWTKSGTGWQVAADALNSDLASILPA